MGRPARWPVIESCRRIDLRDYVRSGFLRDGCKWNSTLTWSSGFSIELESRIEPPNWRRLRLKHQAGGEYDDDVVDIGNDLPPAFSAAVRRTSLVFYLPIH